MLSPRKVLLGAAIFLALTPLAMAIVADESSLRSWRQGLGQPASPGGESEGYLQLTESGQATELTRRAEQRAKRSRGEDGGALDESQRTGFMNAPQPKIITLFPFPGLTAPAPGLEGLPPGGAYRTVCVRLCDGYYWPISYAAAPGSAEGDADTCSSSCQSDTRLFLVPTDADMEQARDLKGKPYSRLRNAYRYRNEYVPSCKCRPDPWEKASLDRHKKYAELAKAGKRIASNDGSSRKRKRKEAAGSLLVSYGGASSAVASEQTGRKTTVVRKITGKSITQFSVTVRSTKRLAAAGGSRAEARNPSRK